MNEVVLKILAQIALNQGDIPKLIKQLQSEVAKAAGVEIPIKFQKPPSDASIRSLIQRGREEFLLEGVKRPSNAQLLKQLEVQAGRQGLLDKFPSEQIRNLGERELKLQEFSKEEKSSDLQNLIRRERARKQIAEAELKGADRLMKVANQAEKADLQFLIARERARKQIAEAELKEADRLMKVANQAEKADLQFLIARERARKQIAEAELKEADRLMKVARRAEKQESTLSKKVIDESIEEAKMRRLPQLEEAVAKNRKYQFDPYAPENRAEIAASARTRLERIHSGDPVKTTAAMTRFEEQMNLRRMKSLEFLGKTAGQTGMQITATSNYLLAMSSILRPLSPMLSNLAMSAGFAAFSLGAIPAALTGAAAGIGGWIALLKISSAEATKAGLATREWKEATFQYNTTVKALLITIGRDVQREFVPVVKIFEELANKLVDLPWHDFIKASADSAEVLLKLTLAMERFAEPAIKLVDIMSKSGVLGGMINPIGSPGAKTSMDWVDKLLGLSIRTNKDRPPYFPGVGFNVRDVRDVGSSIQQSILKTTVQDQILAETVKANEQRQETNEILRKGFQKGVNAGTGIPDIRNMMFPWLTTAEAM